MKKIYLLTSVLLVLCTGLLAQWDGNPATVNNPLSTAATTVYQHIDFTDGADGIITVWDTYNDATSSYEINAQRKKSGGVVAWGDTSNSLLVASFASPQDGSFYLWDVKPDGYGGVYLCFELSLSNNASDIFLGRINSNGALAFGIQVTNQDNFYKGRAKLCVDKNGAIITWDNVAAGSSLSPASISGIFAQRYDTALVTQWVEGGIQVSLAAGQKAAPSILSDGDKGAFIVFADTRNTVNYNSGDQNGFDLYAQHISSSGERLWGAADAVVSTGGHIGDSQIDCILVTDNAGGLIVLYYDWKNAYNTSFLITAQRVNGNGTRLWDNDGVPTITAGEAYEPGTEGVSDGINGVVCEFWVKTGNSFGLYVQHIDGTGNLIWGPGGKLVSEPVADFWSSKIDKDNDGNYVVCWAKEDVNGRNFVRAQKLTTGGDIFWPQDGVDICINPAAKPENVSLVKSNASSMIAIWDDYRNESSNQTDIYCAKVGSNGTLINTESVTYYSATNGNWNNPATWAGGVVPPAGAVVVITNAVTVNTNIICTTLTVQAPGSLTVPSGFTVTVLR